MLSNDVSYREPDTYEESLECAEHVEWSDARQVERTALEQRDVFEVVRTPRGIKPIKSRYVYKRKYNKDG